MRSPVDAQPDLQKMRRLVPYEREALPRVTQCLHTRDQDKAQAWAITTPGDQPYNPLLLADVRQGTLSHAAGSPRWDALCGWSPEDKAFLQLLDRVYSACEAFISLYQHAARRASHRRLR